MVRKKYDTELDKLILQIHTSPKSNGNVPIMILVLAKVFPLKIMWLKPDWLTQLRVLTRVHGVLLRATQAFGCCLPRTKSLRMAYFPVSYVKYFPPLF